jgi:tetratricopeptide (TPR) repeat protein
METQLPNEYQTSVATTIAMSLKRLPPAAQDMMRLFAHLDSTSIARDIIAKSASRQFREVAWTPESEIRRQTREHAVALMKIFCLSGKWSEAEFNKLITQCLQYSLLRISTEGESHFYSMHILVQSYLRANPDPLQGHQSSSLVIRLIGSSVTDSTTYEYLAFNRLILPHLRLIRLESVVEAGDHFGFAGVLSEFGDARLSVIHQERCVEMWRAALGEEHELTLAAMTNLALCYQGIGNIKKALDMEEKVLNVHRRILGPEHLNTQKTATNLAGSYRKAGRYNEALELNKQVLEVKMRVFGPEELTTLITMGNLAIAYSDVNRHQESLELAERVADLYKRLRGPEHPETLRTMENLSCFYAKVGRHLESLTLAAQVLEQRKRVIGPEHPGTLLSMSNLASNYYTVGRKAEALELNQKVLDLQTALLGPEHPDTLHSMRVRLMILDGLRMVAEVKKLLHIALLMHEKALGLEHPKTVSLRTYFSTYLTE